MVRFARSPRRRPTPRRHSLVRIAGVVLTLALPWEPAAAATAAATVEGRWWGTATTPREQIEVGFEIRRNEVGELKLQVTQPVANYWSLEAPGVARIDGDDLVLDELALRLTLRDGELTGHYPGPNSQVVLGRVETLPTEPPVPALPTGPGPRWQTRLNGQIFAAPVVLDGMAYVGTTGGVFHAVAVADGRLAWTFNAGRPIFGDALVTVDAVYFVCDNGYLFRLDRTTGKERWRYDLGDGRVDRILAHPTVFEWDWQAPAPVLADGVVFVGSGDGSVHAVDATDGRRRWRFATGGKVRNGALVDGPRLIVGSTDHFVYALDRATGKELWRHETEAAIDATPVALGSDRVLIGNRGGGLYALSTATGERLWRTYFWGSWVESTPRVVDGVIYIGSSDLRRVSAIDPAEGKVLWRSDVFGWSWGTPVVTADRIYAGTAGGKPYVFRHVAGLLALDRRTGRPLWRWPFPEIEGAHQWGIAGSPVLAGDLLVVSTIEGSVYGFAVG